MEENNLLKRTRKKKPIAERFWRRVNKSEGDGCWLWQAACHDTGYGAFDEAAHRMAWRLTYGPIPDNLFVLHKCDVRRCVRPDHLYLGTPRDNIRDMIQRGRALHRELHPSAKLNWQAVNDIRKRYATGGVSAKVLAKDYGVSSGTIYWIVNNKIWQTAQTRRIIRPDNYSKGEHNPRAKLNWQSVHEIRQRHKTKTLSINKLAKEYAVSPRVVWSVVHNKSWREKEVK